MQEVFEKIIEKLEELNIENQSCSKCAYREECDAMQEKNDIADNVCLCTMLMKLKAIEIVKQEEEQYNNGWIPCSSGSLPDDMEDILIDMGGTKPIPAYIQNGEWYLTDCRGSSEKVKDQSRVIAWHPLPPEYQTNGE